MTPTDIAKTKRRPDRSAWEPPPFINSPGISIEIEKEACTGCDLCVLACPTDCLDLDTDVQVAYLLRLDDCILCYSCEESCKPDCIRVLLGGEERAQ
ncbi:MAG: ferredoxin family protein [Nitrospinota bacterium]|jgi:2-oxoglutarate ferredoxin oxidoreductase subunit delta|nr:ferredoxin family protein [Nitrospinota bacterium]